MSKRHRYYNYNVYLNNRKRQMEDRCILTLSKRCKWTSPILSSKSCWTKQYFKSNSTS